MPRSRMPARSFVLAPVLLLLCVLAWPAKAQSPEVVSDPYRAKLQQELEAVEAQIAQQQKILDQTRTQDVSLERDIKILDTQIQQEELSIRARDLAIQQLSSEVQDKQKKITGLNSALGGELDSLGAIIREKNQLDTTPLVIAALSSESISDFFSDLSAFEDITVQMHQTFGVIADTRDATEKEQADLQLRLEEEMQLRQVQELQKGQIEKQQQQKQRILTQTKGQEKAYQAIIAQNQKSAAQIRAALFELNGSAAIPFSKALEYAVNAGNKTGIRPAFLLGVIAQESDLGENVGTGMWNVDMHPTRDVPIFKAITASLGIDPNTVSVSKKPWYGWGGAMGPAQFIPSTWASYAGYTKPEYQYNPAKDRIGPLTGHMPPNPWNPEDAFMAAAIYLTDSGADAQTASGEFRAAMCYLAGCGNVHNKSLQFYGQQVASLAKEYQCQIDVLSGKSGSSC